MRYRGWWLNFVGTAVSAWQESGENPALFCYLMGSGTFFSLRSHALIPIRVSVRNESLCWNPSATCSTRFIAPRDSKS
jgi:hypothetical protein